MHFRMCASTTSFTNTTPAINRWRNLRKVTSDQVGIPRPKLMCGHMSTLSQKGLALNTDMGTGCNDDFNQPWIKRGEKKLLTYNILRKNNRILVKHTCGHVRKPIECRVLIVDSLIRQWYKFTVQSKLGPVFFYLTWKKTTFAGAMCLAKYGSKCWDRISDPLGHDWSQE